MSGLVVSSVNDIGTKPYQTIRKYCKLCMLTATRRHNYIYMKVAKEEGVISFIRKFAVQKCKTRKQFVEVDILFNFQ